MTRQLLRSPLNLVASLSLVVVALAPTSVSSQSRLPSMPGYDRYQEMGPQIGSSVVRGQLSVDWLADGAAFLFERDGTSYRYDIASGTEMAVPPAQPPQGRGGRGGGRGGGPERGRQFTSADSPDGSHVAFYRDRNLWISNPDGTDEVAVTSDGSEEDRIKYGTASWVYGEELGQSTAMWWSPSGDKLAFYRFDEGEVQDYYLQLDQTQIQSSLDVEAYPKAGTTNPGVALFVHDLATGRRVEVDVRDGQPLSDDVVGHYVYGVGWSPDGTEITFRRTNRRQNVMEFTACNPDTGSCRVIVREEWPASWTDNSPTIRFLEDGQRFVWASERNGFQNYYLYNMQGDLLATLTDHEFETANIVRVDEERGLFWYMARDGDNHMKLQLHRVGLDGSGHVRLTDPAFNHSVDLAPDGRHFIDVIQTHDTPPATRLVDDRGEVVAELAASDMSRFEELGLEPVEMFTFTAGDGVTELHGMLHKPSDFDPTRSYPMLVSVYGGPSSPGARESFTLPSALTEYGFLYLTLDGRNAGGRGKRLLDSIYMNLGVVEIDDMAAAVQALWDRPYLDRENVGIYGTSYGGYASIMAILRFPEVFAAASASSPVTDWRHYDTIYTERYMWTPQGNQEGYDAGSAMTYAGNLEGALMLFYGTADNNVHPSNSMQLIQALQREGKSFEVQVGPDRGHAGINQSLMMEFFIQKLVLNRD